MVWELAMETPEEIRSLIDRLGQALVHAIMTDESGKVLIQQIQETGFDVGVLLEATVALHPKNNDESGDSNECPFSWPASEAPDAKSIEWSDEDKALMCNFRISLD
jgi:hypothetical protein